MNHAQRESFSRDVHCSSGGSFDAVASVVHLQMLGAKSRA
jgi:hypothetical protein